MIASQQRHLLRKENLEAHQIFHHFHALKSSIDIITQEEKTKAALLLQLGSEFVQHGDQVKELTVNITYDGYLACSWNHVWLLLSDLQAILNKFEDNFLLQGAVEDQALSDYLVVGLGNVSELQILRIDLCHTKRSVWR